MHSPALDDRCNRLGFNWLEFWRPNFGRQILFGSSGELMARIELPSYHHDIKDE
jgi:hypothetical protein